MYVHFSFRKSELDGIMATRADKVFNYKKYAVTVQADHLHFSLKKTFWYLWRGITKEQAIYVFFLFSYACKTPVWCIFFLYTTEQAYHHPRSQDLLLKTVITG